jgi:hypothetical protein
MLTDTDGVPTLWPCRRPHCNGSNS